MFCPKCGMAIDDQQTYCRHCLHLLTGNPLSQNQGTATPRQSQQKASTSLRFEIAKAVFEKNYTNPKIP